MSLLRTASIALLVVALLALPADPQAKPNQQQLNQQARQVWMQSDTFRKQDNFKEAKKGFDALAPVYTNLGAVRWVEASRQMSELCAGMPINLKKLKDGTYSASAKGFDADVTVEVAIKAGKLTGLRITQQKESRPKNVFDVMPQQIITRQSPSVDAVAGATLTSSAVMSASLRAILKAQASKP
jgi:uncharacterized protein with FMN-binding domain